MSAIKKFKQRVAAAQAAERTTAGKAPAATLPPRAGGGPALGATGPQSPRGPGATARPGMPVTQAGIPGARAPLPPGGGAAIDHGNLLQRRKKLAAELAELQWDLGGLAYEMAIRDHFRADVLARRAARLQEVDAELGEIERLVRLEAAGGAGTCPNCDAVHGRGAAFCWRCGTELLPSTRVG